MFDQMFDFVMDVMIVIFCGFLFIFSVEFLRFKNICIIYILLFCTCGCSCACVFVSLNGSLRGKTYINVYKYIQMVVCLTMWVHLYIKQAAIVFFMNMFTCMYAQVYIDGHVHVHVFKLLKQKDSNICMWMGLYFTKHFWYRYRERTKHAADIPPSKFGQW